MSIKRASIVADSDIPFLKGVLEPYCNISYYNGSEIDRDKIEGADALIVRTRTRCNKELLQGSGIKAIFSATIGVDHIDIHYCKEAGIELFNAPGSNAQGVVQYILSSIFILSALSNRTLLEMRVGVVGAGNVGEALSQFLENIGVEVLRCDPPRSEVEGRERFYRLEELLDRSHIISLNVPLNESSYNLASHNFFKRVKEGAIFINTSRGEVVDEGALMAHRERLGGLALDVWRNEPLINRPLVEMCDIATPHIAGYSFEGKMKATEIVIAHVANFFNLPQLIEYRVPHSNRDKIRGGERGPFSNVELPFTPLQKKSGEGRVAELMNREFNLWGTSIDFKKRSDYFEEIRRDFYYRDQFSISMADRVNEILDGAAREILLLKLPLVGDRVADQIRRKGITPQELLNQIGLFKRGFAAPKVVAAATLSNSIKNFNELEREQYISIAKSYNNSVAKFIPASGAATRMFKELIEGYQIVLRGKLSTEVRRFCENLDKFPFYPLLPPPLKEWWQSSKKKRFKELSLPKVKELLSYILFKIGFDYLSTPKGVIPFHLYGERGHTPLEEHLYEGALLSKSLGTNVALHFSLSHHFFTQFKNLGKELQISVEREVGGRVELNFTLQSESSDTIAVDLENNPITNEDGTLLFRPGGHGALLENLNGVEQDILFIGNIDNVGRVEAMWERIYYREVMLGVLLSVRERLFALREQIESKGWSGTIKKEAVSLLQSCFSITFPPNCKLEKKDILSYLDRPIRVCGVVKNEGEPGGGPFLVEGADGTLSPQILESAELKLEESEIREIAATSTHFNPVEMVCSLKDYRGNRYNLIDYSDPKSGIISIKSERGATIKVVEKPGLWNGSMRHWNTLFVEIPLSIFTPVKTLFDLLRAEHQPK
ncbi:MAG: DUF4301 family protein [Bacteroidales bacterium]